MEWQTIPDLPLQRIFQYLSKRERLFAALSCRRWFAAFHNPLLWRTFVFSWRPCSTDQHKRLYDIAMYKLYLEFAAVARHFRYIIVPANSDFYALHGFLQQWRLSVDAHESVGLPIPIHAFHLTFASEIIGNQAFGTGGRLLDTLKDVLSRMVGLRCLVLDDLLLDVTDALSVLDEIVLVSGVSLRRLSLVSICKLPAGLYGAALFPNLQVVRLSPPQLNADVLESLVSETQITRLILRQDAFTMWPEADMQHPMQFRPPAEDDWRRIVRRAPWLRLRLEIAGLHNAGGTREGVDAVMWPSRGAPLDQIFFLHGNGQNPGFDLHLSCQMTIMLADFSATLTDFGHIGLPTTEDEENENEETEENPKAWAELIAICPRLETLYIYGCTPTWLLLMIMHSLSNRRELCVRRRMVHAAEIPPDARLGHWKGLAADTASEATHVALCVDRTEREIAFLLQQPRFHFLSDAEYQLAGPSEDAEFIRA